MPPTSCAWGHAPHNSSTGAMPLPPSVRGPAPHVCRTGSCPAAKFCGNTRRSRLYMCRGGAPAGSRSRARVRARAREKKKPSAAAAALQLEPMLRRPTYISAFHIYTYICICAYVSRQRKIARPPPEPNEYFLGSCAVSLVDRDASPRGYGCRCPCHVATAARCAFRAAALTWSGVLPLFSASRRAKW